MAIFRLNYLNQVQIAANTSSRNRTKAIIQRFLNSGIENSLHCRLVQSADKRPDKVFDVNVIYDGDLLDVFLPHTGHSVTLVEL